LDSPIQLSAAAVVPVAGRSIVAYQWQITGGNAFARITSASNASTATVAVTATGTFGVRLSVVDSANETATDDRLVTVSLTPPANPGAGSSGGGALGWPWLLGLLLAVLSLSRPVPCRA
jgi:serine protease